MKGSTSVFHFYKWFLGMSIREGDLYLLRRDMKRGTVLRFHRILSLGRKSCRRNSHGIAAAHLYFHGHSNSANKAKIININIETAIESEATRESSTWEKQIDVPIKSAKCRGTTGTIDLGSSKRTEYRTAK